MQSVDELKRFQPARESYILLGICLFDLLLTIWLVSTHRASEGNPLMAFYLRRGWDSLILVKTLLVVLPLFIAEWGRMHRPTFVRHVLRVAIVAYLVTLSLAFVNTDMLASGRPSSHRPSTTPISAPMLTDGTGDPGPLPLGEDVRRSGEGVHGE